MSSGLYFWASCSPTSIVGHLPAELLVTLVEGGLLIGAKLAELVGDQPGHLDAADRVEQVVRIAAGVNVPQRAVDHARGNVQRANGRRGVEVAGVARRHGLVPRALEHDGAPAGLHFQPKHDQEVRLAERLDETRLGLDEVRIFGPLGEGGDRHVVAADRLDQAGQVGNAATDLQPLGMRRRAGHYNDRGRNREDRPAANLGISTVNSHAKHSR